MRLEFFEIHDQPWFPDFLRREVLDALQMVLERTDAYEPIAGRLREALNCSGARQVVDLFSGAGGPWPSLLKLFQREGTPPVEVLLTDKFPNTSNNGSAGKACSNGITFLRDPIDATDIPERLQGFRTIFSSFHHFNPEEAGRFLRESAERGRGIGVFEVASRHAFTLLTILAIPIADWLLAPFRRPFSWSRIFWTYIIPVVPLVLLVDGLISCLRAYSLADLRAMTASVESHNYEWQIGEESNANLPLRVTYLVGWPKKMLAAD
ncbi:MAG TPA: hypothetical protein VGH17_01280 [Candidatus Acidoferrales bacterium]|jgi:hypothetical protein